MLSGPATLTISSGGVQFSAPHLLDNTLEHFMCESNCPPSSSFRVLPFVWWCCRGFRRLCVLAQESILSSHFRRSLILHQDPTESGSICGGHELAMTQAWRGHVRHHGPVGNEQWGSEVHGTQLCCFQPRMKNEDALTFSHLNTCIFFSFKRKNFCKGSKEDVLYNGCFVAFSVMWGFSFPLS